MKNIITKLFFSIILFFYSASLSATSVSNFIAAAETLKQKGRVAVFTPEFNLLNKEADNSLAIWQSRAPLAKPKVCPTDDAVNMTVIQFIDLLKTVPIRQRNISVREAVTKIMNKNYRCDRVR